MVSTIAASSFQHQVLQGSLFTLSSRTASCKAIPSTAHQVVPTTFRRTGPSRRLLQARRVQTQRLTLCPKYISLRQRNPLTAYLPSQSGRSPKAARVCSAAGVNAGTPSGGSTRDTNQPKATFGSKLRAVIFYLATLVIAVPLFVVMLVIYPFQLLFDRYRRRALHLVNNIWANATTALFYKIDVIGAENLPPKDSPAVYVANHQSYLDIYSLFRLWVPFKFISKTSNFLLPIVGWSMYLTGHIPLKRMDARSQAQCLKACREMLSQGGPLLFFPEGTRSKDQKLAAFKKGAFSVAVKQNVPIVPITLVGTGKLMPSGRESSLHSGSTVKIIVHPPISGTDPDKLMGEARDVIHKTLVEYGAE